jgi:hypothetical protein
MPPRVFSTATSSLSMPSFSPSPASMAALEVKTMEEFVSALP